MKFIELGAGVGLCGIYLAKQFQQQPVAHAKFSVVLTDQEKVLENLR